MKSWMFIKCNGFRIRECHGSVYKIGMNMMNVKSCCGWPGIFTVLQRNSWVPKNWCFWTVVLEKTLESPLDCSEIQPVHPKGNQSWLFNGRTDAEAETSTLATWCEELTHWKRPWCCERLRAVGEGDDWEWDGWMATLTLWTWVWVNSGSW